MKTKIQNAYLVSLTESVDDDAIFCRILWGIVIYDERQRFEPGDYVCSSPVIEFLDENKYKTKNSIYICESSPTSITLPIEAIVQLRAGIEPGLLKINV